MHIRGGTSKMNTHAPAAIGSKPGEGNSRFRNIPRAVMPSTIGDTVANSSDTYATGYLRWAPIASFGNMSTYLVTASYLRQNGE